MPSNQELDELVARAKSGDRDALGMLLKEVRPRLRKFAQDRLPRSLQRRVDASDLVQKACLSAFRRIEHFDGERLEDFMSWLFTIHDRNIKDTIRDHTIAQKRSINREDSGPEAELRQRSHDESPSKLLIGKEQLAILESALEELPARQRQAITLKHIDGLTMSEITAVMACSHASVAGLLRRGTAAVRQLLS